MSSPLLRKWVASSPKENLESIMEPTCIDSTLTPLSSGVHMVTRGSAPGLGELIPSLDREQPIDSERSLQFKHHLWGQGHVCWETRHQAILASCELPRVNHTNPHDQACDTSGHMVWRTICSWPEHGYPRLRDLARNQLFFVCLFYVGMGMGPSTADI